MSRLGAIGGLLALLVCAPPLARAEPDPRVELLTIAPGDEVWTRFGHTAVRVRDDVGDLVFSFGYAPFEDPGFVLDYVRGKAQFAVGVRSWQAMRAMYESQDRTFVRQPLVLAPEREARLVGLLSAYLLPENRHYTYAQLTDNCATRVRDLIDLATDGALRATAERTEAAHPYRDDTLRAAGKRVLLSFTLDVIGGPNQDRGVEGFGALYLPERLRRAVAATSLDGQRLAPSEHVVFTRKGSPIETQAMGAGRAWFFWASFLLALGVALGLPARAPRLCAALLCGYGVWLTAWALVVDTLVVISAVPDFSRNFNVLAFLPCDLLLVVIGVRLWRERGPLQSPRWLRGYVSLRALWALGWALLSALGVVPQENAIYLLVPGLAFAAVAHGVLRSHAAT